MCFLFVNSQHFSNIQKTHLKFLPVVYELSRFMVVVQMGVQDNLGDEM
jgi:hypothetical protein